MMLLRDCSGYYCVECRHGLSPTEHNCEAQSLVSVPTFVSQEDINYVAGLIERGIVPRKEATG